MGIRLAPKPLEIGPLDGFSKSDIFEAEQTGERLANIVGNLDGHSVIVLDGAWGTGKSVFVQQWAGLLRRRRHPVVYFDAFAHDHLDDAFTPLFGELLRAQASSGHSLASSRDRLVAIAARLLRAMPGLVTDIAVRTATGGAVTTTDIREVSERAEAKRGDAVRIMEQRLTHVNNHMDSVRQFRTALEQAVAELTSRDEKPPLVFIIDELDRCRPTYALSVLERMKHVFGADGICFVLVTHLTELERMVERAYGLKNTDVYLHKFYHHQFDFEKLLIRGSEKLRLRYLKYLATELEIGRDPNHLANKTIGDLIRVHDVSLRGQERIMVNQALLETAIPARAGSSTQYWSDIAPSLTVMRHVDASLFRLASSKRLTFSKAMEFIQIDQWINTSPAGRKYTEHLWRYATIDGLEGVSDEETSWPHGLHRHLEADECQQLVATTCRVIDQLG